MKLRFLTASLFAGLVLGVVGACTTAGDSGPPRAASASEQSAAEAPEFDLEAAISATVEAGTARFEYEVRIENDSDFAVVARAAGVLDLAAGNGYAQQFADPQLGSGGPPSGELAMVGEAWLVDGALFERDAGDDTSSDAEGGAGNLLGLHGVYTAVDPDDAVAQALRGELQPISLIDGSDGRAFRGEHEGDSYEVTLDEAGRLVRLERRRPAGLQTTVSSVVFTDFGQPIDYPSPSFS